MVPIQHAWINPQNMRFVGPVKLSKWGMRTDVAKLLQEIVDEMSLVDSSSLYGNNGQMTYNNNPGMGHNNGNNMGNNGNGLYTNGDGWNNGNNNNNNSMGFANGNINTNTNNGGNSNNNPPSYQQVDYTSKRNNELKALKTQISANVSNLPELEDKTSAELQVLLEDEDEFTAFFEGLDRVQQMKSLLSGLINENEELSQTTLQKKQDAEEIEASIAVAEALVAEHRMEYQQLLDQQNAIRQQLSTENLVRRLNEATAEVEEESEQLAEQFLDGDVDLQDFIKQFLDKRTLFYLRQSKAEQLQRQANQGIQQQYRSSTGSYNNNNNHNNNTMGGNSSRSSNASVGSTSSADLLMMMGV
eukprot:TRINITY_DN2631_c1_g1_i2.p1 TRINITY_DN2631_c1_g1~~TRINITY_DN2631_c1_g1_i2.p1  ORF type:complete len:358 (-),score=166.11 TRINITY_DN2631_c1_g1_i2:36-1109(-)